MREYFTLHRSVFPSYLTIESGRILNITMVPGKTRLSYKVEAIVFLQFANVIRSSALLFTEQYETLYCSGCYNQGMEPRNVRAQFQGCVLDSLTFICITGTTLKCHHLK